MFGLRRRVRIAHWTSQKTTLLGDFASFWALVSVFGTDPEKHGADSEKWDQIKTKNPNTGLRSHPFWTTFRGFGGRGAQKVHKKRSLGKAPENERQNLEKMQFSGRSDMRSVHAGAVETHFFIFMFL